MTLTDTYIDCYIKIFNSIKQYDYSIEQYTNILHSMVSIKTVIHSLNYLNYGDMITEEDKRKIENDSKNDFIKAYRGYEYS